MKAHFGRSGKARYVSHEEASGNPLLQIHIDTFSGRPTRKELGLLDWRPGGGCSWFLPPLPMIGTIANQHQALSRRILREHALEFITEYVCGPRMGRALHMIVFNRQDPEECRRVIACCRALMAAYGQAGYPISRAARFSGRGDGAVGDFPRGMRRHQAGARLASFFSRMRSGDLLGFPSGPIKMR
jgi:4-cresol dehydrogenase (hydroxylating)